MNKVAYFIISAILLFTACNENEPIAPDDGIPTVKQEATYPVLSDTDISYADGLSHSATSTTSFAKSLLLDVYYPDNNVTNRPVYMFIHGGGFTGGTKTKPEIIDMANYYASRGWVFVSIDYRTTEELGKVEGKTQQEVMAFYEGIAPQEWIAHALLGAETTKQFQQSIAMYTAQRDAKAALRWIVSQASIYNINPEYITVGGASAGAITTVALGISDESDFRDEMSITEDPTLSTTHLNETYDVKSMVYFWGAKVKLTLFEGVYGLNPYDANDPELFMAHGTADQNPSTPFSEALDLEGIYNSLGIHNELVALEGARHGAWDATVNGKSLSEMTFDFIVERQNLRVD